MKTPVWKNKMEAKIARIEEEIIHLKYKRKICQEILADVTEGDTPDDNKTV